MKYGKALNLIRHSRGLTQATLAKKMGISTGFISLLEKDLRTPSLESLETLANVLDVPVYLIALLASEKKDLKGISEDQASALGTKLLQILLKND